MEINTTNVTRNNISFQGNVSIVKKDSNGNVLKKTNINNTAVINLFKGLGYHLIGSSDLGSKVYPQYLGLGFIESGTPAISTKPDQISLQSEYSTDRLRLDMSGLIINDDSSVSVRYSTTLYYTTLVGKSVNELGLFSTASGDSLLARVYMVDDPISISLGESVVVTWMITIGNNSSEVKN